MHKFRERQRAARRATCVLIGGGLTAMLTASAVANVVTFDPSGSKIMAGDRNVLEGRGAVGGGESQPFNENLTVRTIKMGNRTLSAERGDFRPPSEARLLAAQDGSDSFEDVPPDAVSRNAQTKADFRLALTQDVQAPDSMTPLDAMSGPDFGRMMMPDGAHATRTQIFMSMPEVDDDPLANDDWPELLIIGSVPSKAITITPILDGTPGDPESLVFGTPFTIAPSTLSRGATGLSMVFGAAPAPEALNVIGLDMSGELGVLPGQSVVGYQMDVPPGASFPVKMVPVGQQADVLASFNDGFAQIVGPVTDPPPNLFAPSPPLELPPEANLRDYVANLLPFMPDPGGWGAGLPPPPPIPAPGSVALLVGAGLLSIRRRRG
jgi:hypothetical protein